MMTKCVVDAVELFTTVLLVVLLLLMAGVQPARGDGKSQAAKEAAEWIMQRFSRQVAKETVGTLAGKLESYAARHGDELYVAAKKVGPEIFHLLDEAGEKAPNVLRLLSRFGRDGAYVASRPKAMNLFLKHGEATCSALVKHKGIAEPVIEQLGQPAVRALEALGPQNGRRVAMMLESGELEKIGRTPEVLDVLARYGNPACDFVWKNKGALAVTAGVTAFLTEPEAFINGAKDIARMVADDTLKPLAEVPATVAREATGEIARGTNWSMVFGIGVLVMGGLAALRMRWNRRGLNGSPSSFSGGGQ